MGFAIVRNTTLSFKTSNTTYSPVIEKMQEWTSTAFQLGGGVEVLCSVFSISFLVH